MGMSKHEHAHKKAGRDSVEPWNPKLLLAIRILTAVALLVSAYLAWVTLGGGAVAGCGPESSCDKVLQSRWSKWFGLPVSFAAVAAYAALFGATFALGRNVPPARQRLAWKILVPVAVLVIGSVLWFAGLQIIVIKQICKFCMTVHGCGAIASALILLNAPFRPAPDKPWLAERQVFIPRELGQNLTFAALGGLAVLVAGQALYHPKTYSVQPVASGKLAPKENPVRTFQIYDGRFQFNLNEVPLIGSPTAPQVMVSLFDYTCHYCRLLHGPLMAAHQQFSNQLAIVSLPMPLDNHCNYTVRITPAPHTDACEYARLGLAVWRANREKQAQFDDWIFASDKPPPLAQARQYAAQLVGTNALEQALQDAWVGQQLKQSIDLYATNSIHFGSGSLPQLIIGTNLTRGPVNQADLLRLLDQQFGLRAPAAPAQAAQPARPPG